MAAEDIIIRMGMDANAFNRGLQSAKVQAKSLNSALGGIGMAVGAAGLAAMAAKTVEYGGKISDLSTRLGVSTDALQEFDFAARQNGSSLEEFAGGLQKVGNARSAALGGNEEMLNSFAALGVSVEDLQSKRIEDIFKQIGRSVRDASDVQLVMADAMKVMGKASGPILAAMRNDLEAAAEEAKRLGLIIGEDTIAKLDALGDQADVTGKRLMGAFAPALTFIGEGINTMLDGFQSVWVLLKRTAEMIDAMPTKGFSQAFEDASAGVSSDLAKIVAGQDARRNPAAKTGTGATDFESQLKQAAEIVSLKEKLAEADAKALGIAAQRKKVEEDIAKLKAEQLKAGDAAAEKAKKELPAKIAALEAERDALPAPVVTEDKAAARRAAKKFEADALAESKRLQAEAEALMPMEGGPQKTQEETDKDIANAVKLLDRAEAIAAMGRRAVADNLSGEVAAVEKRAAIEKEIAKLKLAAAASTPAEKQALERKLKVLELEAKKAALDKQQMAAQSKYADLRNSRATAVAAAKEARGERLNFTLAELSGANLRNVGDPTLREDIMKAREVLRLEQEAENLKQRGGVGWRDEAQKKLNQAEKVRAGIKNISEAERFPFKNIDSNIASIDLTMELLLSQAKNDGLNVRAIMAR
jgi:hypothetical protein